jgi:hypothetical protein
MRNPWAIAGTMLMVGGLAACAPEERLPSGAELYNDYCVACHGTAARGDGAQAARVRAPVADLTTLAARNGGEFPLARVMSKVDGYARGTQPYSGAMPELGHLLDGPLVRVDTGDGYLTPTPAKLLMIAEYLETLQQ